MARIPDRCDSVVIVIPDRLRTSLNLYTQVRIHRYIHIHTYSGGDGPGGLYRIYLGIAALYQRGLYRAAEGRGRGRGGGGGETRYARP